MDKETLTIWGLVLLSAALLSLPFLLPHCGFLALVGFVPLLCAERVLTLSGRRRVWIPIFTTFLLWNSFTTFWVCNATVGGGITAIVLNSLQMLAVFLIFRLSRRCFKGSLPYIMLAVTWIAWEKTYFEIDISWPWLTLGNAFAGTPSLVQWYDATGTLGGSLWVWACNLAVFGVMTALSEGRLALYRTEKGLLRIFPAKTGAACAVGLAAVFLVPAAWSLCKWFQKDKPAGETMEVLIAQPNIDPYSKFEALSQKQQNALLENLIRPALDEYKSHLNVCGELHANGCQGNDKAGNLQDRNGGKELEGRKGGCRGEGKYEGKDVEECTGGCTGSAVPGMLVLAPETFTSDVVTGELDKSPTLNEFRELLSGCPGVNLLLGASTYTRILSKNRPSLTSRPLGAGRWYESHNSSIILDWSGRTEMRHKNKLVVAVEKLPYPEVFDPIDRWLGGVMGRCIGDGAADVLHYRAAGRDGVVTDVPLGCAICYESVYGDYCRGYVLNGAKALTIITNDAWWGDTPGYRQHLRYASLRAIETRRAIARCGNTGISGLIDSKGRIVERSPWWKPATLKVSLPLDDSLTFFVVHGDITGRICRLLFCLLLAKMIVSGVISKAGRRPGPDGR